jgi:hypothetical protein
MEDGTAYEVSAYVVFYHGWHLCSAYQSPSAGQALE